MSKQPQDNVSTSTSSLKRKRAPVWPSTTKAQCEEVLSSLSADGILQEFSPPDSWRINPGTTKGKVQHERLVRAINDQGIWSTTKIRQHAQDPSRSAGATGFEGSNFSTLNSSFSKLLRSTIRGGRGGPSTSAARASEAAATSATAGAAAAAATTATGTSAATSSTSAPKAARAETAGTYPLLDSWDNYGTPTIWIDDPFITDLPNEPHSPISKTLVDIYLCRGSTPSSTRESSPESLSSVPSTAPVDSPEAQSSGPQDQETIPPNETADSPKDNYRGADGLRYFPDGRWHPNNIYATDGHADYNSPGNDSSVE